MTKKPLHGKTVMNLSGNPANTKEPGSNTAHHHYEGPSTTAPREPRDGTTVVLHLNGEPEYLAFRQDSRTHNCQNWFINDEGRIFATTWEDLCETYQPHVIGKPTDYYCKYGHDLALHRNSEYQVFAATCKDCGASFDVIMTLKEGR